MLIEADGGPIAVVITAANRHDQTVMRDTLEAVATPPPNPVTEVEQHLCIDMGYSGQPADATARVFGSKPHCKQIGTERLDESGAQRHIARRLVVERTHAWLNGCRGILF